jgi:hypothetical protein
MIITVLTLELLFLYHEFYKFRITGDIYHEFYKFQDHRRLTYLLNLRSRGINRDTHKLVRTSIIKKKSIDIRENSKLILVDA